MSQNAIGTVISKFFENYGVYIGIVVDITNNYYTIIYEDGDIEDISATDYEKYKYDINLLSTDILRLLRKLASNYYKNMSCSTGNELGYILKEFPGHGMYYGVIESFTCPYYKVRYEDNDTEELEEKEIELYSVSADKVPMKTKENLSEISFPKPKNGAQKKEKKRKELELSYNNSAKTERIPLIEGNNSEVGNESPTKKRSRNNTNNTTTITSPTKTNDTKFEDKRALSKKTKKRNESEESNAKSTVTLPTNLTIPPLQFVTIHKQKVGENNNNNNKDNKDNKDRDKANKPEIEEEKTSELSTSMTSIESEATYGQDIQMSHLHTIDLPTAPNSPTNNQQEPSPNDEETQNSKMELQNIVEEKEQQQQQVKEKDVPEFVSAIHDEEQKQKQEQDAAVASKSLLTDIVNENIDSSSSSSLPSNNSLSTQDTFQYSIPEKAISNAFILSEFSTQEDTKESSKESEESIEIIVPSKSFQLVSSPMTTSSVHISIDPINNNASSSIISTSTTTTTPKTPPTSKKNESNSTQQKKNGTNSSIQTNKSTKSPLPKNSNIKTPTKSPQQKSTSSSSTQSSLQPTQESLQYVKKHFPKHGNFYGVVVDYINPYFKVIYEDDDIEEYSQSELKDYLTSSESISNVLKLQLIKKYVIYEQKKHKRMNKTNK